MALGGPPRPESTIRAHARPHPSMVQARVLLARLSKCARVMALSVRGGTPSDDKKRNAHGMGNMGEVGASDDNKGVAPGVGSTGRGGGPSDDKKGDGQYGEAPPVIMSQK